MNESHRGVAGAILDAQLIADIQSTSGDAIAQLLRRYTRLVHRVAFDILRDVAEAEDVTQEVFFEVYRKAHLYDAARGSVRVWLLQYAYHRSLRRKDALGRRAAYRGEPLDALEARTPGPRRALTIEECRWVIRSGLAQLPERQRATLQLVCLEGLSLNDVASRLQVSFGCARHYYYRGLARLRVWARSVSLSAPKQPASERDPSVSAAAVDRAEDQTKRQPRIEVGGV